MIKKASLQKRRPKIGIIGPSGSGKTYSALLLAKGMVPMDRVCVVDTENSCSNYCHLGDYSVYEIRNNYHPENYIKAIDEIAASNNFSCVIVDSISPAWDGEGGVLEMVDKLGGRFTDWKHVHPLQSQLKNKIIYGHKMIVICCFRAKTKYTEMEMENGRKKFVKLNLGPIQKENFEYEFDFLFNLTQTENFVVSKDRSGVFSKMPISQYLNETHGRIILDWAKMNLTPTCDLSLYFQIDNPEKNTLYENE